MIMLTKPCRISIHALREEGDEDSIMGSGQGAKFLSTPSARRATGAVTTSVETLQEFLSTPSARRATEPLQLPPGKAGNFYPRPPRGGRLRPTAENLILLQISIHALREEGDW